MACFRICLFSGLAALALVPANLAVSLEAPRTAPVADASAYEGMAADEPATSAVLLGGALILMIAGRRRRY